MIRVFGHCFEATWKDTPIHLRWSLYSQHMLTLESPLNETKRQFARRMWLREPPILSIGIYFLTVLISVSFLPARGVGPPLLFALAAAFTMNFVVGYWCFCLFCVPLARERQWAAWAKTTVMPFPVSWRRVGCTIDSQKLQYWVWVERRASDAEVEGIGQTGFSGTVFSHERDDTRVFFVRPILVEGTLREE